jgi:hypothetical protein
VRPVQPSQEQPLRRLGSLLRSPVLEEDIRG